MRLTAKFQVPKVNLARFRQALHERLSENLAQARHGLATKVTDSTRVRSGMECGIACDVLAIGQLRRICPFACSSQQCAGPVQLGIENGKAPSRRARKTRPSTVSPTARRCLI